MEQSIINVGNWIFSGFWHFVGCCYLIRCVVDFSPLKLVIEHKGKRDLETILEEVTKESVKE